MFSTIQLNGKEFSFDFVRRAAFDESLTPFERTTLQFCKDWLNDQEEFVIATSGSTGPPKKITIRRSQMIASARQSQVALALKAGYRSLLCLDPSYIAGIMMIVRSFVVEMELIGVAPSSDPFVTLPDTPIDFAALVPYQLENVINTPHSYERLDQLKSLIIGGSPPTAGLIQKLQTIRCPVFLTYGMTETLSHIALRRLNGTAADDYFHVLPEVHIGLDDRGCLTIQSAYLGPTPIITNDLVEIKSPTTFQWLGRMDDVINSGGIKLIPAELEHIASAAIEDEIGQRKWFMAGLPDPGLGQKLVLITEGVPLAFDTSSKLLGRLSKVLTKYQLPKEIHTVAKFPLTATQKIDRRETLKILASPGPSLPEGREGRDPQTR